MTARNTSVVGLRMIAQKKHPSVLPLALGTTIFVSLYPDRYIADVDLGSLYLHCLVFAAAFSIYIIANKALRDEYYSFRSNELYGLWAGSAGKLGNLFFGVLLFVSYAGILEIFKNIVPGRQPSLGRFAATAASVSLVAAIFVAASRLKLLRPR